MHRNDRRSWIRRNRLGLLLQETERRLCALVGLGQHRCPCLDKGVPPCQLGRLLRHVDIDDPAGGGLQICFVHDQQIARKGQAALLGAVLRPVRGHILEGGRDVAQNDVTEIHHRGRDKRTDAGARAGEVAGDERHRRRGVAVFRDGDRERRGAKEGTTVEFFRRERGELRLQSSELGVVVRQVRRVLGRIGVQVLSSPIRSSTLPAVLSTPSCVCRYEMVFEMLIAAAPERRAAALNFMDTAKPPASSAGLTIFDPLESRFRLFWSMEFEDARLFEATVAAGFELITTDMVSSLI
jgi:hypothetical protein